MPLSRGFRENYNKTALCWRRAVMSQDIKKSRTERICTTSRHKKTKPLPQLNEGSTLLLVGDLAGNRTRDCAVRGRRLNRLTTRPYSNYFVIITYSTRSCNRFCAYSVKILKKRTSACAANRKRLTRITAGGCTADGLQTFRFATDLA